MIRVSLLIPTRDRPAPLAAVVTALLVLWELVNLAGFAAELGRRRVGRRSAPPAAAHDGARP